MHTHRAAENNQGFQGDCGGRGASEIDLRKKRNSISQETSFQVRNKKHLTGTSPEGWRAVHLPQ